MYEKEFSLLDQPEVLQFVFYPRRDRSLPPSGASDHVVAVGDGVELGCRFYPCDQKAPSILYFHGNGEVASDYDYVAPLYARVGLNLFVADYRGYGASTGNPSFSSLIGDAHVVFRAYQRIMAEGGYVGATFIMGRSLGSIPAIELAAQYGEEIQGLIIESGLGTLSSLMRHVGFSSHMVDLSEGFPNVAKIKNITVPLLVMHGEIDSLLPATEGQALYENSSSDDKRLVIVPDAGHNDIMLVGGEAYFEEIRSFVRGQLTLGKGA